MSPVVIADSLNSQLVSLYHPCSVPGVSGHPAILKSFLGNYARFVHQELSLCLVHVDQTGIRIDTGVLK